MQYAFQLYDVNILSTLVTNWKKFGEVYKMYRDDNGDANSYKDGLEELNN